LTVMTAPTAATDAPRIKLYGLTTTDRPDRARRLTRELQRTGLDFHIHRADRPAENFGFASVGLYGCFLSHLACLRQARADGVDIAIVVEDDAVIMKTANRAITDLPLQLGAVEWKVIHLGYLAKSPAYRQSVSLVTKNIARSSGWEVVGAHFYAVRADALDSLIDNCEQRLGPNGHRIASDGVINEYLRDQRADLLVALPCLAHQAPSPSGTDFQPGWRTTILRQPIPRQLIEIAKRAWWNAQWVMGPQRAERRWNRRAQRSANAVTVPA
jgi:glycosyl transferase, family 25